MCRGATRKSTGSARRRRRSRRRPGRMRLDGSTARGSRRGEAAQEELSETLTTHTAPATRRGFCLRASRLAPGVRCRPSRPWTSGHAKCVATPPSAIYYREHNINQPGFPTRVLEPRHEPRTCPLQPATAAPRVAVLDRGQSELSLNLHNLFNAKPNLGNIGYIGYAQYSAAGAVIPQAATLQPLPVTLQYTKSLGASAGAGGAK